MSKTDVVSIIIHNTPQARNAIYPVASTLTEAFKGLKASNKFEVEVLYGAGAY